MAKMAASGGAAGADDDDDDDDGVEDEHFPPLSSNKPNTGGDSKGVGNHWDNGTSQHMSQGSLNFLPVLFLPHSRLLTPLPQRKLPNLNYLVPLS